LIWPRPDQPVGVKLAVTMTLAAGKWLGGSVRTVAAGAVSLSSCLYGAVLLLGLAARSSADDPIPDPWLSLMELLILAIAPSLVALIWSMQLAATPRGRLGWVSCACISLTAATTCAVHGNLLLGSRAAAVEAFRWPSVSYAADIIAWDVFFPLSALSAATLIKGRTLARAARLLFILAGLLALAGLAGVPAGDMRIRNVGVLGYAVVFPIATAILMVQFALVDRRLSRGEAGDLFAD
jgi:hypothetical protein